MNSNLLFFSNFLKNPKEVAAIAPSSKYVIKRIIRHIDFNNARYLIEYGPGVGNVTEELLMGMNSDAKLICFESNIKFYNFLNKSIKDNRLVIINNSAEMLDLYMEKFNIENVDYILSGIPFTLIKKENKKNIIKKTKKMLRKGGKFIVYQQYNWHLKKYLYAYFKNISIYLEVRNMPPTFIFVCEKT